MKWIRAFPHLTIILSMMCLVFFVIDRFNGNMAFLSNEITKWIVAALSVTAIVTSALCIGGYIRADEEAEKAHREANKEAHKEAARPGKKAGPMGGKAPQTKEDEPLPFEKEL